MASASINKQQSRSPAKSGVNECRTLCDAAVGNRKKAVAQMEKVKGQLAALNQKKKSQKGKPDPALASQKKALMDKLDRLKEKVSSIGEELLIELVQTISRRGNLVTKIRATNGEEAGSRVWLGWVPFFSCVICTAIRLN